MNSVCQWLLVALTIGTSGGLAKMESGGLAKMESAELDNSSINAGDEHSASAFCDCLIVVACIVVIAVITTVSWRRSVRRRR